MQRFIGTLVRPLADQTDRDGHKIDPAGVQFTDETQTIWRNFSYEVPDDVMGTGVVSRAADGSLIVTGLLTDEGVAFAKGKDEGAKLAIGIKVENSALEKGGGEIISTSELMSIGLTWEHQDPSQPAIRFA